MDIFLSFLKAFAVGGAICAVGQIIMDLTKLTPGRILVCFVVAGVVLGAVGVYAPLAKWAGAGATVPLTGFGFAMVKGVKEAIAEKGAARHPDGSSDRIERGDNRGGALRSYRVICCETKGKIRKSHLPYTIAYSR